MGLVGFSALKRLKEFGEMRNLIINRLTALKNRCILVLRGLGVINGIKGK